MRIVFPIIILLFFLLGKGNTNIVYHAPTPYLNKTLDKSPEFFVLQWKEGTKLIPKKTEFFIEVDSLGKHVVAVLLSKEQQPVLYASEISTPVCADGECKLMNIKLYWTLLGEYAGFDRYPDLPLTKHDHDEFKVEDYQKLHELLIDDKSILGRRSINQLVEKPTMRTVNGVDAISGATVARVKESVVGGALYSCYVAWYLVHGDVRDKLKNHTLSVLKPNMILDMLYSKNADYHLFALEALNGVAYAEHYLQVANVFKTSTPLVRSIIAKEFPTKFKNSPDLQKPFWEAFEDIDLGSRSLLMKNLDTAPAFAFETLSTKFGAMSKNQLKTFLNSLNLQEKVNDEVQSNLEIFANSEIETYGYLVANFLETQEP